jgi:hypothetical protein
METKPKHTIVILPNDSMVEVTYFCTDKKLSEKQKQDQIDLIIQLDSCHYPVRIPKSMARKPDELDCLVHNTVISARGHLC